MLNSCTALYKGLGRLGQFMGILYSKTTGGDDTTKITNKLEELLEAIENQDSSAIMSLFSESSKEHIEEFEASTEELINYYSGVHQSTDSKSERQLPTAEMKKPVSKGHLQTLLK